MRSSALLSAMNNACPLISTNFLIDICLAIFPIDFQRCIGASLYEISHRYGCNVDSRRSLLDSWSIVMGKWWRLFLVCDGLNQCSARCPDFHCGRLPAAGEEFHLCNIAGETSLSLITLAEKTKNEKKNLLISSAAGFERSKTIVGLQKWPMHAKYNARSTALELIEWHPIGRRFDDK